MKKLILIVAICIAPMMSQAQSFDKYANMRDVSSMIVTSNMFKLLAEIDVDSDDPETQAYVQLIENLKDIKVLSTDNLEIAKQMQADFKSYISSSSLQTLMTVKDDGKLVEFYSKPGSKKSHVSELMMLVNGDKQTVVLSLTGDIDLKTVSKLAKDLDVPGAEELKKVE
ncbi:DUF4252 domain-containing protein [Mesonia sp. K7]|uniref:DUF4252 domain-containing protein n=1 Tax=Mesonia sp. K7 TaxID=2218606 RepID=UPI000DA88D7E|nr:DUF4252 domain-containing protein [Mesonia sp. K7]PZD79475.1 DUF4252 domain-containing protein [Mesonia sp. K7]